MPSGSHSSQEESHSVLLRCFFFYPGLALLLWSEYAGWTLEEQLIIISFPCYVSSLGDPAPVLNTVMHLDIARRKAPDKGSTLRQGPFRPRTYLALIKLGRYMQRSVSGILTEMKSSSERISPQVN